VNKLKYLSCKNFVENSCKIDTSGSVRNFNNIMTVAGHGLNETATVHLINKYCLPSECGGE